MSERPEVVAPGWLLAAMATLPKKNLYLELINAPHRHRTAQLLRLDPEAADTMLSARAARTALGGRFSRHLRTTAVLQADVTDVALLEKLLKAAKDRDAVDAAAAAAPAGDDDPSKKFQIQGFNAISNVGLDRFPKSQFLLTGSAGQVPAGVENEPHAVVLCRSWLDKATRPWPGCPAALAGW